MDVADKNLLPTLLENLGTSATGQGWHITISFGKSSSPNYLKAVALAKAAPQHIESRDEKGNLIHQAVFGPKPNEYLSMVALYELVEAWKSTFVFINGNLVDRKVLGQINYCYGDKCRSGKRDFCFGASPFTENPFGCHRIRLHSYARGTTTPWYSYGFLDSSGVFHVDKLAVAAIIAERLMPYVQCPGLDITGVAERWAALPDTIDPRRDPGWVYARDHVSFGPMVNGLVRKEDVSPIAEISVTVRSEVQPGRRSSSSCCLGCVLPIAPILFGLLLLALF